MKSFLSIFAAFAVTIGGLSAQESTYSAINQYYPKGQSRSDIKCHYKAKRFDFCKAFPNFAMKKGICRPAPAHLGNIEWCREEVTITERDDCGNFETYNAVVVTYRKVYGNGAWGEKFKRTYRKDATIVVPPVLVSK